MPHIDFSVVLSGEFRGWLLAGFLLSLKLTLLAWLLSLPLATAVALCRLSSVAWLRGIGAAYVEIVRNIPLLVHLLFWYFAMPVLLPDAARDWLNAHDAEFACALIALTLYTASFMAEDIRSGIRTVPITQMEATRALGFGYLAAMRRIVLPQAIRITVPPLISQTLNLWKNTSVATVIGTAELMYQAQRVETASFRGIETFGVTTLAYLCVSLLITALAACYQRYFPVRAS
jgi:polar amino acid transport system permease protein